MCWIRPTVIDTLTISTPIQQLSMVKERVLCTYYGPAQMRRRGSRARGGTGYNCPSCESSSGRETDKKKYRRVVNGLWGSGVEVKRIAKKENGKRMEIR